jgi:hypothetical protein
MMVGIILVVAVVAVAALFMFNGAHGWGGANQPSNNPTNIQVNPPQAPAPPAKVDVNVNPAPSR